MLKKNGFDEDKINGIPNELFEAYEGLQNDTLAISIFGSSRTKTNDHFYKKANEISSIFSQNGYKIITGGGGGIMEASNKGADSSIGFRIKLPKEQNTNQYVKETYNFSYFASRKMAFMQNSHGYVILPGGFGTLDELSEILCHMQTKLLPRYPIVLFGKAFFEPMIEFLQNMLDCGYIEKKDFDLFIITDCVQECVEYITNIHKNMELK